MVLIIITFCINLSTVNAIEVKPIQNNNSVEELYNYINQIQSENELLKKTDIKTLVLDIIKTGNFKLASDTIISTIKNYIFGEVNNTFKIIGTIIFIAVLCALLNNLQRAFNNESISSTAYFACFSLIIAITSSSFAIGVKLAVGTINRLADFMLALIPVLMILLGSVGAIAEATVMDPIIIMIVNVGVRIYTGFIIPIICVSFVLNFINNLTTGYKIDKLSKLLSSAALWIQGLIMIIFVGIVTIRGIAVNTFDEVTMKTAKFAVDSFIPVVGKCLSDAISTVAGYSLLLKNALSVAGLLVIVLIVLLPIIKLMIIGALFKLSAAIVQPISDNRLTDSLNAAGNSIVILTSCLISVSLMFFIMISIIAAAGRAIINS